MFSLMRNLYRHLKKKRAPRSYTVLLLGLDKAGTNDDKAGTPLLLSNTTIVNRSAMQCRERTAFDSNPPPTLIPVRVGADSWLASYMVRIMYKLKVGNKVLSETKDESLQG